MKTSYGMKRSIGGKSTPRLCRAVMRCTLVLLLSSYAGCVTKPGPLVSPDGRGCVVGFVDSTEALLLRVKNPAVKAGDVIMPVWCADQYGEDVLNEVYELTR